MMGTVNPEIFANSAKRHICDVKNLGTGHDLHISVNDRVISPIPEGLISTKLKPSRKFQNLQFSMAPHSILLRSSRLV